MIDLKDCGRFFENEELKKYTSFKIGGPAKYVLFPKNEESLIEAIKRARKDELEILILGNGSNVLCADEGYDGLVIILKSALTKLDINDNKIIAGAGLSLRELANAALDKNLSGLEFAHGIPGSVGGGAIMNAGAYGSEMKDVVSSVKILDEDLNVKVLSNEEMDFSYRHSIAQDKNYIILEVEFSLNKDKSKEEIKNLMDDLWQRRLSKQPLEYPSAGSTFRRPEGHFVGQMVDQAGLRGLRHGGAMVSDKHSGFIINKDKATAKDVRELIEIVQKVIFDKFSVKLQREVKYIGGENGNSCNNRDEWSR